MQFTSQPRYDLMFTLHVLLYTIDKTHLSTAQEDDRVQGEAVCRTVTGDGTPLSSGMWNSYLGHLGKIKTTCS